MHFGALYNSAMARPSEAEDGRSARRVLTRAFALAMMLLILPCNASAHAVVLSATPAVNSSVPVGPIDVVLTFNSRIDVARSRLWLRAPGGTEQPVALSTQPAPGSLAGRGEVAVPGAWILRWQVLSVDGHITRGDIPFVVQAGAAGR